MNLKLTIDELNADNLNNNAATLTFYLYIFYRKI